jgi:hypothetical protein
MLRGSYMATKSALQIPASLVAERVSVFFACRRVNRPSRAAICVAARWCWTIGLDIGKNTIHLVGLDQRGAIAMRIKVSRNQLIRRLVSSCHQWKFRTTPSVDARLGMS